MTDTCPATNRNDEPCGLSAGWGTDNDSGPCKFHGGASSGAPEGNGNAITHGATAQPINLYENFGDDAREWVDAKVDAYLTGDETEPTKDAVRLGVLALYQAYAAHGELAKEGLSRTSVVGTTDHGAITDEEEHYLNKVASRHITDFRMLVKDAGKLDDPGSQQADAMQNTADAVRAFMHEADR